MSSTKLISLASKAKLAGLLVALAANGARADEPRKAAPIADPPITPGEAFMAERQSLAREMSELIESGATPEEIGAWREKNADRHAALREAAMVWSARQKPPELPFIEEVHLPAGASESMEDFLVNRAELHNSRAALLNGLRDATEEQRHQALEAWHTQNAAALEIRQQLAKRLGDEQPVVELEVPALAHIPLGASPELEDFLIQRHALMKERAEISNQLHSATPEVRQQAFENWHANNATRLQAMREAAARLSK